MSAATRWVQHISGQGLKWAIDERIADGDPDIWMVSQGGAHDRRMYVPKLEYRLCEPSEQWVDVTGDCCVVSTGDKSGRGDEGEFVSHQGERIAKLICGGRYGVVLGSTLRVEKKVSR